MKAQDLVSIIIPMYGVEAYLPQCLDSVCDQTWNNLEILLIDDESPDLSGQIAEEYAKKDSRVKVFHIKNRGAAGARNVGLEAAHGSYIMFVDSDDWLEPDAVERLMRLLRDTGSDVAQCQYFDEYTTGSKMHICDTEKGFFSAEQFLQRMLHHWEDILIWNKIFSRAAIGTIRFEEGHCIDDEFFTYQIILKASRIAVSNEALYHYRQRKSGAMRNSEKAKQRFIDQIEFVTKRFVPIVNVYPILRKELSIHLTEVLYHVMREGAHYKEVFIRAKRELRRYGVPMLFQKYPLQIKKTIISFLIRPRSFYVNNLRVQEKVEEDCFA